jgi:CheY-like chemotaxis protein
MREETLEFNKILRRARNLWVDDGSQKHREVLPVQRILVVDDEVLVADTLSLIFRKHGFDARVAYSGEQAMDCAHDFQPELLLCDISMPGMGGLKLIADMARDLPRCRILVLTGYYSNLEKVRAQARKLARPAQVLIKPCSPRELLREAGAMLAIA